MVCRPTPPRPRGDSSKLRPPHRHTSTGAAVRGGTRPCWGRTRAPTRLRSHPHPSRGPQPSPRRCRPRTRRGTTSATRWRATLPPCGWRRCWPASLACRPTLRRVCFKGRRCRLTSCSMTRSAMLFVVVSGMPLRGHATDRCRDGGPVGRCLTSRKWLSGLCRGGRPVVFRGGLDSAAAGDSGVHPFLCAGNEDRPARTERATDDLCLACRWGGVAIGGRRNPPGGGRPAH